MSRGTLARACALAASVLLAPACVIAPVDHASKPCPCATGYVCDTARDRCVAGSFDAGTEPLDAGPVDPRDAGVDAPDAYAPADAGADADDFDAHIDDPTTACDDLLSDAIFCESFEDRSMIHWTVREAYDGTVGHTFARAFRGVGSLTASSTAPGGYAERIATVVGGVTDGDLYVRAYVHIPEGAALDHSSLVHIGGHRSRTATEPLAGFNAIGGFAAMYIGAGGLRMNEQLVALPRGVWFCMQYQLHVDDVAGSARLWIDGTPAGELLDIDTRTDSPYVSLGAGVAWSTLAQEPFEVAIDEIAIGRSPLPCEMP
ncbi:MAG: hypothetical protein M3Y87_34395 [Myxococcota bacterium]|nr:hypothetical protein [Myxococcota bacterium]